MTTTQVFAQIMRDLDEQKPVVIHIREPEGAYVDFINPHPMANVHVYGDFELSRLLGMLLNCESFEVETPDGETRDIVPEIISVFGERGDCKITFEWRFV